MTEYNNTGNFKRYSNELETFEEDAGGNFEEDIETSKDLKKSHDYNGENSVYIIFIDGKLSGYVKDEKTARMTVFNTASSIVDKKKQNNDKIKVYIENVENGINIYSQTVGAYINGFVNVENKIHWVRLDPYEI
jgi:hypothetical protein